MIEVQKAYARRLRGQLVRVASLNGCLVEGTLMSFNGKSLWLVGRDDTDLFVDLTDVVSLVPTKPVAA